MPELNKFMEAARLSFENQQRHDERTGPKTSIIGSPRSVLDLKPTGRPYYTAHNLTAAEMKQLSELCARIIFSFGPSQRGSEAPRVAKAATTVNVWAMNQLKEQG